MVFFVLSRTWKSNGWKESIWKYWQLFVWFDISTRRNSKTSSYDGRSILLELQVNVLQKFSFFLWIIKFAFSFFLFSLSLSCCCSQLEWDACLVLTYTNGLQHMLRSTERMSIWSDQHTGLIFSRIACDILISFGILCSTRLLLLFFLFLQFDIQSK